MLQAMSKQEILRASWSEIALAYERYVACPDLKDTVSPALHSVPAFQASGPPFPAMGTACADSIQAAQTACRQHHCAGMRAR